MVIWKRKFPSMAKSMKLGDENQTTTGLQTQDRTLPLIMATPDRGKHNNEPTKQDNNQTKNKTTKPSSQLTYYLIQVFLILKKEL